MCSLGARVCQNPGGAGVSLRCAGSAPGLKKKECVHSTCSLSSSPWWFSEVFPSDTLPVRKVKWHYPRPGRGNNETLMDFLGRWREAGPAGRAAAYHSCFRDTWESLQSQGCLRASSPWKQERLPAKDRASCSAILAWGLPRRTETWTLPSPRPGSLTRKLLGCCWRSCESDGWQESSIFGATAQSWLGAL